ncbi:ATP-binding protein [Streptomyces sp. Ag109_O5-10]|uniref:ATP-binding protein n=1 Tax=Streptomyces sp. Ag109_O5-10 TaxID=1855349 RepID=UPI00089D089F|nr:ATP-binding protein [Streptomyces sp. Ag109_O5-10]SEF19042.1 Tetratricopeptide (TPR) repeat [Streptomyces sp. Ag109_O5-10]
MGRREQLSRFAHNLAKDPLSLSDPAAFLFHLRGVGGVGKSTLLRRWREAARQAGAVTALVDDSDVPGVLQALTELARQLAEQAGPLKGFDKAVERYRREQEAATEPAPVEGGASPSSRIATQAGLAAASVIPGAGPVVSLVDREAAAQQLDRLRAAGRGRRSRDSDLAGVSRAFVEELCELSEVYPWVVLFFDTWEQTGRYLDDWLPGVLQDESGPLPANVIVVLAGRDKLADRQWGALRSQVNDESLEAFTEAETRELLAMRGVSQADVAEAVWQMSKGLPLYVELLALTRPTTIGQINQSTDAVDTVVERFVQWINDPHQRETVLACALATQLNEDIFSAVVPPEARALWAWLCGQPFVSGHGDFKRYHAIVRASMVRWQRTRSPQSWTVSHQRLADAHAAWRADAEQDLAENKRWGNSRWRQHHLAVTYHQLCGRPAAALTQALEQTVHAAEKGTAILRQWIDAFEQAARDTTDPTLLSWADRLRHAAAGNDPALACLTTLLTHGSLAPTARAWAHTYRGRRLYHTNHEEEALTELNRAITTDPHNRHALAYRGDIHRSLSHAEQAFADLNAALALDPTDAWALAVRGIAHHQAGRYELALADLTAALDLDPTDAWALAARGVAHHQAGRYELALADLNAALDLDPTNAWALNTRGETHRQAGRYELALADLNAALDLDPTDAWALTTRGEVHRQAGRYELALVDLNAALALDPTDAWALAARGVAHRQAGRYELALVDLNAALALDPTNAWALAQQRLTRQEAEHPNDSGA